MSSIKRLMGWLVALVMLMGCASAESISGQRYDVFEDYYADDIYFINDQLGRYLLPLAIAGRKSDEGDGRMYYEIFGDVLSLTVRTDPSGSIVEMCQIVLTAPADLQLNTTEYNDFSASGYHSYALLMAMDASLTPQERYALVTQVNEGLAASDGTFTMRAGVYDLTCTRVDGTATLTFENPASTYRGAEDEAEDAPVADDAEASPEDAPSQENEDESNSRLG